MSAAEGEWDQLLQVATPLLHPWLAHRMQGATGRASRPPEPVIQRLEAARRGSALLHLRRASEYRSIHTAFQSRGIDALVLKGFALAGIVYPDPSLRPMIDIDLAVAAEQWPGARDALLADGFRVPARHATRPVEGAHAMVETSRPFQRPKTKIMVDLHPELDLGSAGILKTRDELLSHSMKAELQGVPARVPDWKSFVVHICSHCSERHLFDKGLLPLLDLTLTLRHTGGEIDWSPEERGWIADPSSARYMTVPMILSHRFLGATVPPIFHRVAAADPRMAEVLSLAGEQLFGAGLNLVSPGLVEVASRSPSQRLAHLARRLNPWRSSEAGGERSWKGAARAGVLAARRLAADLATRSRIYTASWRRGDLTRENLERALSLQEGRGRLAALLERRETGATDGSSPRRPGAGEG